MNWKVFSLSVLALIFVALAFWIDWLFLIGAVIIMFVNQRLLFSKKTKGL